MSDCRKAVSDPAVYVYDEPETKFRMVTVSFPWCRNVYVVVKKNLCHYDFRRLEKAGSNAWRVCC